MTIDIYVPVPNGTLRETDFGYDEVTFDAAVDFDDPQVNGSVARIWNTTPSLMDWRDPYTLWIWYHDGDNDEEGI